jgi:hypothetical protein
MTPHLRDTEFVDLLDGALPIERMSHVERCQACRERADAFATTVEAVQQKPVPEPSPLFWEHFSARVRTAIENEPAPARGWRQMLSRPSVRWSAVATAAALLIAVGPWRASPPAPTPSTAGAQFAADSPGRDVPPDQSSEDLEADEAWALVRSVADELDADEIDAAGVRARPGAVERVASGLSDAERVALAELIQSEIKARPSVPSS